MENELEHKISYEKEIAKICEANNLNFVDKEEFEKLKQLDLLPLVLDRLNKFIKTNDHEKYNILSVKYKDDSIKFRIADNKINSYIEPNEKKRPIVILPTNGKLISEFATDVANIIRNKNKIFFRPTSNDILEITSIKEKETGEEYIGFSAIKPERFITLAEKYFRPNIECRADNGAIFYKPKSMSSNVAKVLLSSPHLQNALPKIKRIFPYEMPIIYEGSLTFPKKGYDERFESYTLLNAPEINKDMPLEEAKELITQIYCEFCFEDKQDFTNAIANLLTPFIKGLFNKFSNRTPLFAFVANRERAGKDYCAAIQGIVHEGYALEEPPISSGERSSNNNDELRKKMLSAFMAGRKRLHFANNKGYINNAVFEGVLTSEKYSDRALGRNEILNFDNEMDYSLSGNIGIGLTPDLANRARIVRLLLDIEDANAREFENPNLHAWLKENRGVVLSALFSLVKNWFDKGMPNGSVPFSSFPEWARICGGIMESAGFDNPCKTDKDVLMIGGDTETSEMKALFELCYEKYPEDWISKKQIFQLIMGSDEEIFGYIDFNSKSDQTKIGTKITKFIGRTMSNIMLKVDNPKLRGQRQRFMFTKKVESVDRSKIFGNLGNVGNVCNPKKFCGKKYIQYSIGSQGDQGYQTQLNLNGLNKEDFKKAGYSDEEINELTKDPDCSGSLDEN